MFERICHPSVRNSVCSLAISGLVFLFILIPGSAVFAAEWLHFGHDNQYTSFNPEESTISPDNISQMERKWGIGCDDTYFSVISRSPAIYNSKLYTSGAGSRLTAHNAESGEMLWQFGNGNMGWAPQPVVSVDGIVFYMEGSDPTHLYAVDADNGSQLWEAPLAFDLGFNDTALTTVDETNGLVYVVEEPFIGNGKLYALNKQTGDIVWYKSKSTDDAAFKGDYVLLREGTLYVAAAVPMDEYPFQGDHMIAIDTSSQTIDTTFNRPQPEGYYDIKQYALCNDKIVVGFDYQHDPVKLLVAYDQNSPSIAWQKEIGELTGAIACNTTNNVMYVPAGEDLYALDAETGSEIWSYQGYDAIYSPTVANGLVYFISDTNMYAVSVSTGNMIFSYPLGHEGYETTQVAVNDGMLFFSGNGGTCDLYALGLPSSQPENNAPSTPVLVAPNDDESGLDTTVTLQWNHSTDPDGDTVSYQLYYCPSNDFNGCSPIDITSAGTQAVYLGMSSFLLLIGIVFRGQTRRRKRIAIIITSLMLFVIILVACSSGNSSTSEEPSGNETNNTVSDMSYTVSGLNSDTVYYWKVVASDGNGGSGESDIWRFKTQ